MAGWLHEPLSLSRKYCTLVATQKPQVQEPGLALDEFAWQARYPMNSMANLPYDLACCLHKACPLFLSEAVTRTTIDCQGV